MNLFQHHYLWPAAGWQPPFRLIVLNCLPPFCSSGDWKEIIKHIHHRRGLSLSGNYWKMAAVEKGLTKVENVNWTRKVFRDLATGWRFGAFPCYQTGWSLRVPVSLPGNGKELFVGSKPAWTHARSTRNPYIMDVVLMMPLETRTVWLPYDLMHGTVCHHEWKTENSGQEGLLSGPDTHTDFKLDHNGLER